MSEQNQEIKKFSILLVDDEKNITSSLNRLLRKDNYEIHIAGSGLEGLAMLENNNIDLIVSDMRMPHMDGAEFLKKAKVMDEKIIRILLTGYSDMSSTISAINDAEIFRYISKPWNDDDFRLTIRRGLELRSLGQERIRLKKLTDKQNEELISLNKNLESKVELRTQKIESMMDELRESSDIVKKNYLYIIKTFSSLTDMRGGHLEGHSRRVADNARKLATLLKLNSKQIQDIFFGSLLHDIGKIGLSDDILSRSQSLLTATELAEKKKHSVWGEGLLLGMENFQNVSSIIRHHHERYDGTGYPDQLSGEDIPLGARVLAIVNDFDGLQSGALYQKRHSIDEAIIYLKKHQQSYYDPKIVKLFVSQFKMGKNEKQGDFKTKKGLFTSQLKPGMVLSQDLFTKDRMLLLTKGQILNTTIINRLVHHENTMKEIFTVKITVSLVK